MLLEKNLNLLTLSPSQFENMTFDLVSLLGLRNVVWRTPGSDGGRDIEGTYFISDLSGHYQNQKWYVECKRYTNSVDWPTVWGKISYAESNGADVLLFVTSSSLTPQAVDNVNSWNKKSKKPIIRFWGEVDILSKLNIYPQIACKYGLVSNSNTNIDMFEPIIQLLLKVSHSIDPDSDNIPSEKIYLIHSLSELVSVRSEDIKKSGSYYFRPHKKEDLFSWFDYKEIENISLDKYSTRAFLSYIRFILKTGVQTENINKDSMNIKIQRSLLESEKNHIQTISNYSNFSVLFNDNSISLQTI